MIFVENSMQKFQGSKKSGKMYVLKVYDKNSEKF